MKKKCLLCGKKSLVKKIGVFHFEVPDDGSNPNAKEFQVDIPDAVWDECESCGEFLLSEELDEKIERWQYTREGLLLPEELKSIRKKFGLTQEKIAKLLNVGEKTYTRWETGSSIQTKAMDNLIRLFAKYTSQFLEIDSERNNANDDIVLYLNKLESLEGKNEMPLAAQGNICNKKTKQKLITYIKNLAKDKVA